MSFTQAAVSTSQPTTDVTCAAAEVLAHLERTWNQADGAAFGEVFTDDCDFVDVRGVHHTGAIDVGAGHQAIFDTIYRGSVVTYTAESARLIAPGVVVAVAGARLECPSGPLQGVNQARLTVVLTEEAGTWSVAAFHNTLLMNQG
jgi:uncharacterized protein (TIGR02246 family)